MSYEVVDPDQPGAEERSGRVPWKLLALLLVVIVIAVFFFQNGDDAPINFLWFDGEWPVWLVIGVSVLLGVVLDRLGTWAWRRARRRRADEPA